MSLMVMLLVVTLVTQCWSASPQRRNWTPQAILYLKGAQGQRAVLQRTGREEVDTLQIVTPNQSNDGPGLTLSSILLELLQTAVKEGGGNPDNYAENQEMNWNYL